MEHLVLWIPLITTIITLVGTLGAAVIGAMGECAAALINRDEKGDE